jgi:FtsP/CotA-like multicopper oxidase with cupredoxin domain
MVRFGLINVLLGLALAVGVSALNAFAGNGSLPLSSSTVRALDLLVDISRYAVPSLAFIGTIATFGAWWRARAALAREVEERRAKLPLTLRGGLIGHILLSLNLAGSLTFGATVDSSVRVFNYSTYHECSWGTGRPTVCAFTLTNQPESTVTLHWTGVSRPGGATFQPGSGTLAPGETSQQITVTAGYACPIVFAFRDEDQDLEINYRFDGSCD